MKSNEEIKQFVQTTIIGMLGSVVIGFVFFQSFVFQFSHPASQFLLYGISGSILFATLKVSSIQKGVGVLVLLIFLLQVVLQPEEVIFVFRDIFFIGGLGITMYLFIRYFYIQSEHHPLNRPLLLGALLALNGIIVTVILKLLLRLFAIAYPMDGTYAIHVNLTMGFLIGIGLGSGFELSRLAKLRKLL